MKIDITKLQRDYINQPLIGKEKICKEDLHYLYIICNLSQREVGEFLNKPISTITRWLKFYNIVKPKNLIKEQTQNYNLEKYGVKNYTQAADFRKKAELTCLERYGTNNIGWDEKSKQKRNATLIKNYGVDNAFKSEQIKKDIKQKLIEHYGAKTYCESQFYNKEKEMKKRKQTNLDKYGTIHPMKLDEFKEKQKKTIQEKYGVDNIMQSNSVVQKRMEHIDKICQKTYDTKKKNHTFNSSAAEEIIYEKLMQVFPLTQRQYTSDLYPYPCDFYIPELDLYIEYQGFFSHGDEPFNKENDKHKKILEDWTHKASQENFKKDKKDLYKVAIHTWTYKDPQKRQTAKENNLNWIEFFTIEDFEDWYESIS